MCRMRISSLLGKITVSIIICCFFLPAQAKYGGGTGGPSDPYLIFDANQMNAIYSRPGNKHFKLMADIDLSGYTGTSFNIIGSYNYPFTGVFDGSGHTISNFTYDSNGVNGIGLFGYIISGEIKNLGLIDPNIDAGTGNLVGSLVGLLLYGTITNCYSTGCVSGLDSFTGGLAGIIWWDGTITDCYSTASVEGNNYVGGLVGLNEEGTITNCYASGDASGEGYVGGLVGWNAGWCGSFGCWFGTISNCYSMGSVDGYDFVGGLVGYNGFYGSISNCHSTGDVNGDTDVGGLVGCGSVSNCYSTSDVSGTSQVGGLVGWNDRAIVSDSFWDIDTQTHGVTESIGLNEGTVTNVSGFPTAQMQTRSTFTDYGWDFVGETINGPNDIWTIHDTVDYPKFVWKLVNFIGWDGVDFRDYSFFANHWMDSNCGGANDCDGTDLDFSDKVDWADMKIFSDHWLEGTVN